MTCDGERFAAEVAERRDEIEDAAEDRAMQAEADAAYDRTFNGDAA